MSLKGNDEYTEECPLFMCRYPNSSFNAIVGEALADLKIDELHAVPVPPENPPVLERVHVQYIHGSNPSLPTSILLLS